MKLLAPLLLFPSLAFATTLADGPNATFEALAARSQAAAYVRVLDQSARYEGSRIVTDSRCEVLQAAFGVDAGTVVTLTTLGGTYGNIGQQVFGLERPAPGDELALLLGDDGYMGGGRRLVGFSLGIYRVLETQSQTQTEAPLLGYAQDSSRVVRDAQAAPSTLGEFLARAKQAKR